MLDLICGNPAREFGVVDGVVFHDLDRMRFFLIIVLFVWIQCEGVVLIMGIDPIDPETICTSKNRAAVLEFHYFNHPLLSRRSQYLQKYVAKERMILQRGS